MDQVEPFAEFLARTANARPEQYAEALSAAAQHHGLSAERMTAEFERMKNYILSYYEGVRPVHSFLTSAGQPVDCVPFEQQPAVRAARAVGYLTEATPPTPVPILERPPPGGEAGSITSPVSGASLPPGTARSCPSPSPSSSPPSSQVPPGTVPLLRITLERLIPLGTLDRFFHKTVSPPITEK